MGGGLKMICKAYGGMRVSADGVSKEYVWDYKRDCAVSVDELREQAKKRREERKVLIERAKKSVQQMKAEL